MGFIYCLIFPNGKKYVGKTTRTVEIRVSQHKSNTSKCTLVKKAYEKYGTFKVETILEIENDQLDFYECHYIKEYNTLAPNGYNLTDGGEGGIPTEETRERMRQAHKNRIVDDNWRFQISKGLMGHKLSDETKEKIRQAHLNNPIAPSEENRRKINEKIKSIEVREKSSRSKRKDNFDLPMYIHTIRKESNPGYCVSLPGQSQKHFTSKVLSMEEKLKLALEYKNKQITKQEAQIICSDIINELIENHYEMGSTTKW